MERRGRRPSSPLAGRMLTQLPLAAALVVRVAAGLLSPLQPRYAL